MHSLFCNQKELSDQPYATYDLFPRIRQKKCLPRTGIAAVGRTKNLSLP